MHGVWQQLQADEQGCGKATGWRVAGGRGTDSETSCDRTKHLDLILKRMKSAKDFKLGAGHTGLKVGCRGTEDAWQGVYGGGDRHGIIPGPLRRSC